MKTQRNWKRGDQTSSMDSTRIIRGVRGKAELRDFKNGPKQMSHGHRYNVVQHVADGSAALERRYVLMDYEQNKQLKARMLTRLEAWRRNETLRGTGFAWALCEARS